MSQLEAILIRMIREPAFADAVFSDPTQALAGYGIPNEEIAKFRALSRADFDSAAFEFRKLTSTLSSRMAPKQTHSPLLES